MNQVHYPIVYPSAIDRWLMVVVAIGPLVAFGAGAYALVLGKHSDALVLASVGFFSAVMCGAFMFPCRYTLLEDTLSIRCGIFFWQIAIRDIEEITKSSTILSGPALSLKRVEVRAKGRSHIVSPKDRDKFIQDVNQAILRTKATVTLRRDIT